MIKHRTIAPRPWILARAGFIALLLSTTAFPSAARAQQGRIRFVHDPCIMREGDTYYVYSTGLGITIRGSRDLFNWFRVGRALDEDVPAWAKWEIPGAYNLWAPDLSYFGGQYHLYYTVSALQGQGGHRSIGVATNVTLDPSRPDYRWIDRGKVIESFEQRDRYHAIDPNIVLEGGVWPWLAFGSARTGIKLIRIDPGTGMLAPERLLYTIAERDPTKGLEAAFIVHKNGDYYLFASYDLCCKGVNSTYNIRVGRARQVIGPYIDRLGRPMLQDGGTMLLASYGRYRGPGHCAVLLQPEGDYLVHHFYDAAEHGTPKLQIRPLYWAADGFPLAGEPISGPPAQMRRVDLADRLVSGSWKQSVDFHDPFPIVFAADGTIREPNKGGRWILQGTNLTLHWPALEAPGGNWSDQCIMSPDGTSYTGRNQLDSNVRGFEGATPWGPAKPGTLIPTQ